MPWWAWWVLILAPVVLVVVVSRIELDDIAAATRADDLDD